MRYAALVGLAVLASLAFACSAGDDENIARLEAELSEANATIEALDSRLTALEQTEAQGVEDRAQGLADESQRANEFEQRIEGLERTSRASASILMVLVRAQSR